MLLYITIDIIHRTGLETNHMRQLVVYILYSAMRVWNRFMYSAISQEKYINGEMPSLYIAFRS